MVFGLYTWFFKTACCPLATSVQFSVSYLGGCFLAGGGNPHPPCPCTSFKCAKPFCRPASHFLLKLGSSRDGALVCSSACLCLPPVNPPIKKPPTRPPTASPSAKPGAPARSAIYAPAPPIAVPARAPTPAPSQSQLPCSRGGL